jgi:hypothetical protein
LFGASKIEEEGFRNCFYSVFRNTARYFGFTEITEPGGSGANFYSLFHRGTAGGTTLISSKKPKLD